MLASLLYPYDDDAPPLIDGWLQELESQGCVSRYERGGNIYLQICNWLTHQKIDKPSKSRLPAFDDSSRKLAKDREASPPDLVPRIVDLVPRIMDQNQTPPLPLPKFGRGVDIWQAVLQKLKEDFASAYVSNKHFQDEKFDKHFRDSHLVKIEDGVAFLDAPDPQALADGLRQFHQRVSKTFLAVAGFEVKFQLLARQQRHNLEASA
jgi:helix-turn-helix protein